MIKKVILLSIFFLWIIPNYALALMQIYPSISTDGEIATTTLPISGCYVEGYGSYGHIRYGNTLKPSEADDYFGTVGDNEDDCTIWANTPPRYDIEGYQSFGDGTYFYILGMPNIIDLQEAVFSARYFAVFIRNEGVWSTSYESFNNIETNFFYLDPSNSEVVATSTSNTFYADLYLSEDDYEPEMFVRFKYIRQEDLQAAVANQDLLWHSFDLTDTITDGYNFLATTTGDLGGVGKYYFKAELHRQNAWYDTALEWIGLDMFSSDLVVSSTTEFIYDELTAFEQTISQWHDDQEEFMASSTAAANVKKYCDLTSEFSLGLCISALFIPSQADLANNLDDLKNNLFTYVPFGYITRVYDILATTSTTSLAVVSFTFPEDFIVSDLSGENFYFNPWQYFYTEGAPVKDEIKTSDGKDVWQIFEPLIKIVVYMTLLFMIVRELLSIKYTPHPKGDEL